MLTWKTIRINEKNFIGMYIALPKQKLFIITSTHCILVGEMFNVDFLSPRTNVLIMKKSNSFKALLESEIKTMNQTAQQNGYHLNMNGKEALLYTHKTTKLFEEEI